VDAVAMMVRLFRDPDVVHTLGEVDPRRDVEIIETELILSDFDSVDKQLDKWRNKTKSGDKVAIATVALLEKLKKHLGEGKPARSSGLEPKEMKEFGLLTSKPVLFVGNTDEKPDPKLVEDFMAVARERGAEGVTLCGKIEAEIAQLPEEDRGAFLSDLGLTETGLQRVIVAAYKLLNQASYFTAGEQEVRAWTFTRGWKAPQCAGVIHTDFEKGFIKAEIYSFADIDKYEKESALREKGLIRSEGKEYVMQDGDVCFFKFNV
jgi:ribosome-binding ATPase